MRKEFIMKLYFSINTYRVVLIKICFNFSIYEKNIDKLIISQALKSSYKKRLS